MLNRLYDSEANARANHFKWYLASWQYCALSATALRGFEHRPNQTRLFLEGGNLGSVIYKLKTENEREYRNLIKHLQTVDPSIDIINFSVPSDDKIFMFFEDRKGKSLPAPLASSGTLRYLALLYVLVAQPQWFSSLRIVEEPENGIYVGYLKDLLEATGEVKPPQQLIFTSHSPYFVDLFDDKLDSIFLMKRGDYHSSITQPDPDLVRKRLENFPLGEQHFREMLG
jgi:predicted ATPase